MIKKFEVLKMVQKKKWQEYMKKNKIPKMFPPKKERVQRMGKIKF